ncbi:MAG: site-specific integrase [Clostridiales bacterium]|nr:site-specific integrase [Clostridiales bacterium]
MQNNRPDFKIITFGEWLSLWFNTYKKPTLAQNSIRNIEQIIRLHTPQYLKDLKMREITLFDIDSALSSIPKSRTRTYVRQVWNNAFLKAEKLGIVEKNLVSLTESISYKKKKSKALTVKEQREFLQALEKSKYKWLMLFYLHTGVRRAEALSLEWKDIDYENNLILIKGTKTDDSFRHILLTEDIKEILQGRKKQAKKEKERSKRVFPYSLQTPSKAFKKLCPNHHLHDLRHTFITRCAECGVNVNVCQQVVGHSTADMTLNVYMHVLDEFKRKELEKFTLFPKF